VNKGVRRRFQLRWQLLPRRTAINLPLDGATLPPARENPVMTPDEPSKLQKDLPAARDRQPAKNPEAPRQLNP
jgi:hypothetical protein